MLESRFFGDRRPKFAFWGPECTNIWKTILSNFGVAMWSSYLLWSNALVVWPMEWMWNFSLWFYYCFLSELSIIDCIPIFKLIWCYGAGIIRSFTWNYVFLCPKMLIFSLTCWIWNILYGNWSLLYLVSSSGFIIYSLNAYCLGISIYIDKRVTTH